MQSGKLNPLSAGEVTVSVNQPGNNRYSAATQKQMVVKILAKRSQAITFGSIGEQRFDRLLDLNATSSAGLPVTFEVSAGVNIANIVNSTKVKFSGLGSVTVKATQAGNNEYVAAAPVTQTFLVKKPMLLIFDPVGDMGRGPDLPGPGQGFRLGYPQTLADHAFLLGDCRLGYG